MTHLRKIMLEELERRNYAQSTTRSYIHTIEDFARYFKRPPDQLGPEHIGEYQAYLFREQRLTTGTVTQRLAALRFFFIQTMRRQEPEREEQHRQGGAAKSTNSGVRSRKFRLSPMRHNSAGLVTGSDFNITWCTRVKIAVVAPIPSASIIRAVAVNPGAFRNCRAASRKSASMRPPAVFHSESLPLQRTESTPR